MKHLIVLVFAFLSLASYAQKKKDKDKAPQPDTVAIANQKLTEENKALTAKADSLSKELDTYFGLYTVIRDKVVKKDFDPARMAVIIDSLKAGRDSLTLKAAAAVVTINPAQNQSIQVDSLIRETQGLLYTVNLLRGKPATGPSDPKQFIGTWNLVLRKMKIVGQAPRTGIADVTDEPNLKSASPLELNPLTQVTFIDGEFAEFTFRNGEKAKCYYVIDGFSSTKSYFIDFKGIKLDIRLYLMYTILGPRITFEVPGTQGVYYFGQMTQ